MTTITIPLSEQRLARLQELAARAGVPPEELLRVRVEQWLADREAFAEAARYVFQKNEELYRRLA